MASRKGGLAPAEGRGGQASTSGLGPSLGTTRNRSEVFFKYRRQVRGVSAGDAHLPGTNGDAG